MIETKTRIYICEVEANIIGQMVYGYNSLEEPIWGCIEKCPYLECEYNLNPKSESERYNLFGRTSVC